MGVIGVREVARKHEATRHGETAEQYISSSSHSEIKPAEAN